MTRSNFLRLVEFGRGKGLQNVEDSQPTFPGSRVLSQALRNVNEWECCGQYDKTGLEFFACRCGDPSNFRQTGKRGESTMRHMSIRLRPDFGR